MFWGCSGDTARDGEILADEVRTEAGARVEHVALDAAQRESTGTYLAVGAARAISERRIGFDHIFVKVVGEAIADDILRGGNGPERCHVRVGVGLGVVGARDRAPIVISRSMA